MSIRTELFAGAGESLLEAAEQATTAAQIMLDVLQPDQLISTAAAATHAAYEYERAGKGYSERRDEFSYVLTVFYREAV